MKQKAIAIAFVQKEGSVLLDSLQSGLYSLLRDSISLGEPWHGIKSRLFKVFGREVPLKLIDVVSFVHDGPDYRDTQVIAVVYLATPVSTELRNREQLIWHKEHKIQQLKLDEVSHSVVKSLISKGILESRITQGDKNVEKETSIQNKVIVYSDGGSRGNPGPSAAGFVILNTDNELLFEGGSYLGITTNNQAEYHAVKMGLEKAHEIGARIVDFRMDSLLVVNQMLGIYQIKNRDLWPIYTHIKKLVEEFEKVTFSHVRREFNKEADAMVNRILDEQK